MGPESGSPSSSPHATATTLAIVTTAKRTSILSIFGGSHPRITHECRQPFHQAHKTISRCREVAFDRQRRQLSPLLHSSQRFQLVSAQFMVTQNRCEPCDTVKL